MNAAGLREVQERIKRACAVVGRDPASITMIAVTKTQPLEAVLRGYDLGVRDFGESRLQEAVPKIEAAPKDIRWHFIGNLQSNKARHIGSLFGSVHTIYKAAQLKELAKAGHQIDGFVEVNIAEEPQKAGLFIQEVDDFVQMALEYELVSFRGLMTIGPALSIPEAMRPYFRAVREANERVGGQWLSMGMSHDFDVAIQEGATHIRVGTALFGAR